MKLQTKLSMIMLVFALVALSACGNSTSESSAQSNNQPSSNTSPQVTEEDDSAEEVVEDRSTHDIEVNNQEDSSAPTTEESTNGERENSDQPNVENQENQKEKYFKKLNSMYEPDRHAEVKETMVEMEEQEAERYQNWDKMLNEIYGVLQAQLPSDEMDQLREEQRNWVEHRDEAAKKASLKYEGGTTESLEYVATQASLTQERCFALVAKYMN